MSKEVDTTKYNWLLDPNRETNKIKVEFLKDCGANKKGDRRIITTEEYLLYSDNGDCKSAENTNNKTERAFEDFERINGLPTVEEKQREWLKSYEGLNYTESLNGNHPKGWNTITPYNDEIFSPTINKIQRKKSRLVLENDEVEGEPNNPKEKLEELIAVLKHYGISYIRSTHNSKNSDHLLIEFTRDITTKEAKSFIKAICPKGAITDINFALDTFLFPILYAVHWKGSEVREMPIDFFKGRKIDFDALKIPKANGKEITLMKDGLPYNTYKGESDVKDFLSEKGINKKTGEMEYSVDIDAVADHLIEVHGFKTWFGTKSDYSFNWNGKKFDKDARGIIKVECENLLRNYCKRNVVDEVFEKVKRKTKTTREEFEKDDTNFINLNNGIWDIKQKKLIPHNPKYNFQHIIQITKDDNPLDIHNCQNWLRFINETLYPEDILVMQEWFGFMLFREYFIKKAVIGIGEQDTGKSVLMDTAIMFIGEENKTGLSLQKIGGGSDFTKLSLKGKHLNAYDDLSSQDVNDGGAFKVATGGGYISGEEKFGEFQQFRSFAAIFLMGNKCPPIKDNDDLAYFGRYMPIKFDNVPEKLDPFLRKKLWTEEEMSGILNWALEGLYRLLENGKFSYNKTNQETKSIMEISGCPLVAFSSEVLIKEDGEIITKDDMYKVYSVWCEKKNRPRLSKEMLGRQLTKYCPYILAEKHKERIWKNAKFVEEYEEVVKSIDKSKNNDSSDTSLKHICPQKKLCVSVDNSSSNMGDIIKNKVSEVPIKDIKECPKCQCPVVKNKCINGCE